MMCSPHGSHPHVCSGFMAGPQHPFNPVLSDTGWRYPGTSAVWISSRLVRKFSRSCVYQDVAVEEVFGLPQIDIHRTVLLRCVLCSSAFFRTNSHSWPRRSERHLWACHAYEGSRHRLVARFLWTSDSRLSGLPSAGTAAVHSCWVRSLLVVGGRRVLADT